MKCTSPEIFVKYNFSPYRLDEIGQGIAPGTGLELLFVHSKADQHEAGRLNDDCSGLRVLDLS